MKPSYLLIIPLLLIATWSFSQSNPKSCPSYPQINYFNPDCYTYLDEIKFGQGRVKHPDLWGDYPRDIYVPSNRPEWAIASMHGYQLMRNILKSEYYHKHVFFGTALKESFWNCDANINFDGLNLEYDITTNSNGNWSGTYQNDGCYHTAPPGYLWLREYYPWRHDGTTFEDYVSGDNFIRGMVTKVHYDLLFIRFEEHAEGLDPLPVLASAADPLAADIWNAKSYNKGYGAAGLDEVMLDGNRANSIASADWLTLSSLGYDYTRAVSHLPRVLDEESQVDADNYRVNYYDHDITWAIMDSYMDEVLVMYPELTAPQVTAIKSATQAVFNIQDTDNNGIVSFRYEFGPVLDAFIIAMPYDDPMTSVLNTQSSAGGCAGCIGPVVTIKANGPTEICEGLSVELETIVGSGFTYQWTKDGSNIANSNSEQHIYYATETGSFSVLVTNASGCEIEAECPIDVIVNQCSSCDLVASPTISNNSCTGIADGSISIALSGGDYNNGLSYEFEYEVGGNTSSASNPLNNLIEGTYLITVTDPTDPSCQAFTTAQLEENTEISHQVELTNTRSSCDEFDLYAEVIGNPPSTCEYNLTIMATNAGGDGKCWGATWVDSEATPQVKVNGNVSVIIDDVAQSAPGNCVYNSVDFSVSLGDAIDIVINTKKQGGNVNPGTGNFKFVLTDPEGNATDVNFGSLASPSEHIVHSTSATCEQATPDFNFNWVPSTGLTALATTTTTALAHATIASDQTYTIEATSSSYPGCVISDTTLLDFTCSVSCDEPGTVSLDKTGNQDICIPINETLAASVTGSGTFEYSIDNGTSWQPSNSFSISNSGTFSIQVRDANDPNNTSCLAQSTDSYTINSIDVPTTPIFSNEKTSVCQGESGVNYSVNADPNASNYTWNYNGSDATINGSSNAITVDFGNSSTSGDLTVSSGNSCGQSPETSVAISVNQSPDFTISNLSAVCSNQTIDLTTTWSDNNNTGATITYHNASPATIGNIINNEAAISIAGSYYILGDNGGCSSESEIVVSHFEEPSATISGNASICNDGASTDLIISLTSGSAPFSVDLLGTNSVTDYLSNITSPSAQSVSTDGTYSLDNLVDGNGCPGTVNGSAEIQYFESVSGSFTVNCKDVNPSLATDEYEVVVAISFGDLSSVAISSNLTGITWNNNNDGTWTSSAIPEASSIDLTISDNNNCGSPLQFTGITGNCSCPISGTLTITGNNPTCSESTSSIEVSMTGATGQYNVILNQPDNSTQTFSAVNGPTVSFDVSQAGNYFASIEGIDEGCSSNTSFAGLAIHPTPTAELSGGGSICDDGSTSPLTINLITGTAPFNIDLIGTNSGTTILTDINDNHIQNETADGDYSLANLVDGNGCMGTVSGTSEIIYLDEVIASAITECKNVNPQLDDDQFQIHVFVTQGDQNTINISDNASLTWTDLGNGEWLSSPINEITTVDLSIIDNNNCGSPVTHTGLTAQCSCEASITDFSIVGGDQICEAGTDSVEVLIQFNSSAFGPYDFTISNGSETINSTSSGLSSTVFIHETGDYSIVSFNAQGTNPVCGNYDASAIVSVSEFEKTTASFVGSDQFICSIDNNPANVEIDFSGGKQPFNITYTLNSVSQTESGINDNQLSISVSESAILELISVSDDNCPGAILNATMTVTTYEPESPEISSTSTVICTNESVTLNASKINESSLTSWYKNEDQISNSDGLLNFEFEGSEVGTFGFQIEAQDPKCSQPISSNTMTIEVLETPSVYAGDDLTVNIDETITLNGSVTPSSSSIQWTSPLSIISGSETMQPTLLAEGSESEVIVSVTATQANCSATDQMRLLITRDIQIFSSFSPNGDQINDVWTINGIQKYPYSTVKIFNRWGEEIFISDTGYTTKWDGQRGGKALPVGTYYYIITLIGENESEELSGSVTIVR